MGLDNTAAKTAAKGAVDQAGDALVELSHLVHAHPELAFEEVQSSKFTADALAGAGF
jgi:metal-dependent amidase/aminoacylase/carboxypeptidase family protein